MADQRTGTIRNVAIVGGTGSGKTTLVEALLVKSGTIGRAGTVEDGSTVCFVDLPYSFWQRDGSCEKLESFLDNLRKHQEGRPLPYILVQAPAPWRIKQEAVQAWLKSAYGTDQRDYRGQKLILLTPDSPQNA